MRRLSVAGGCESPQPERRTDSCLRPGHLGHDIQLSEVDVNKSLETFRVLRENNLAMLKKVPKELWENYGEHTERGRETISHIVRMFAGHDLNHLGQIEQIAKASRRK